MIVGLTFNDCAMEDIKSRKDLAELILTSNKLAKKHFRKRDLDRSFIKAILVMKSDTYMEESLR